MLAALGALDRRHHVQPFEAGALDLFAPAHGVAGRSENHLETLVHLGILFAHLDGRVDDHFGNGFELGRHHHVDPEDAAGLLGVLEGLLKNFAEDHFRRIVGRSAAGFREMLVNRGLILLGGDAAGGEQSQHPGVGRGDAQLVVAERPHAGLNDGILGA